MSVLVTGAAGFIGYHICESLLSLDEHVVGVDNMGPYHGTDLKQERLARLTCRPNFRFVKLDLKDADQLKENHSAFRNVDRVLHMAAQAGVRASIKHPRLYTASNIEGFLNILELARKLKGLKHLVYASSSSVYGNSSEAPFRIDSNTANPVSLYAATKRAGELLAISYANLYGIPLTGLRFFTVYGPWGRPDMSPYIFVKSILENRPIKIFNHGKMFRDFTYIDDIVAGALSALKRPPEDGNAHQLYNLGNNKSVPLLRFVEVIEEALDIEATKVFVPMQPGDVFETCADIESARTDLGYEPRVSIEKGIPEFVRWFRKHYGYT